MSYTIGKKSGNKTGPISSRIQNTESILRLLKEIEDSPNEFYELEPMEVVAVHLDASKSYFPQKKDGGPDYSFLGGVKGRFVNSELGKNIDSLFDYKPLNPNFQSTPVVGEIVIGVKYLDQRFYTTQINLFGNPNFNTQHGISVGKKKDTLTSTEGITDLPNSDDRGIETGHYFKRTDDARRLLPNEGDVIIEGRFGNSIRIGSDIRNENEDSPNMIISVGHTIEGDTKVPIEEKIDTDGSSIYMTTNQELKPTLGAESKLIPSPYDGKQIFLNSDRIILNTKEGGDILFSSNKNVGVSAVGEVVIEAPTTKIGGVDATEPIVLGDTLESKLNDILTLIETGLLAPTGPVVVGPGAGILASLKSTLGTIKSPSNKVK
tara:strand:+ start:3402 stop:4532 length:1131 start_codon:yes stop_codon:yes gene_type:complete